MDLPEEVLAKLTCGNCNNYLSCVPIFLKTDGESICGRCTAPLFHCIRNEPYEELAFFISFPCRYQELGCKRKLPFRELKQHEDICEFLPFLCPLGIPGSCKWYGPKNILLEHCEENHPEQVISHPCTQKLDISKHSINNFLTSVFYAVFILQIKVCLNTNRILHSVRLIGDPESVSLYKYKLKINKNDVQIKKQGVVTSQNSFNPLKVRKEGSGTSQCSFYQPENFLETDINALLSILGDFEGTTFTVTISMTLDQVRCVQCGENITKPAFKDVKGWRCTDCAPCQISCQNRKKGCKYRDIQDKVHKHEYYYCKYSTWCWICGKNTTVPLVEHYAKVHSDVTQSVGVVWRAKFKTSERLQIVSSEVGTILCRYRYHSSVGVFGIHSPLHSEELSEYSCELRLINPENGRFVTKILEVKYDFVDFRTQIDPDLIDEIMIDGQCDVMIELIRKFPIA